MTALEKLVTRDQFGNWLTANGVLGAGVEIGTYTGNWAETVATQWPEGKIITIDPYDWDRDPTYVDGCKIDWGSPEHAQLAPEAVMRGAALRLAKVRNVVMVRERSLEAASQFSDGSLAFAYLDGNHAEEAMREEVKAWLPKVRPGGVFAGHDFYTRDDHLMKGGVFNAIWDFSHEKGWKPHVTQCTSWWFIKP